jgi:hypothetical protein
MIVDLIGVEGSVVETKGGSTMMVTCIICKRKRRAKRVIKIKEKWIPPPYHFMAETGSRRGIREPGCHKSVGPLLGRSCIGSLS